MKHPSIGVLLSLLALASAAEAGAEHPFCLWTKQEAAEIRRRIETDPVARQQYEQTVRRVAEKRKLDGIVNADFLDLFNYLVMGDQAAGQRQLRALRAFIGQRPDPMTIEFALDEKNHQWVIGMRSHNDRHHSKNESINILRYDILYHDLTAEERRGVEEVFRLYIEFHLAGAKPWHPDFRYDRASWLPNLHWWRPISTHAMAAVLQDRQALEALFHSAGGFKWFMDEYLGDGRFYMEEFCKYECLMHGVILYCETVENLGWGKYGYGYLAPSGGCARHYIEMYSTIGLPRVMWPDGAVEYPAVSMGDSGEMAVVPPAPLGRTLYAWEMHHRRFPEAHFDYFLAQARPKGQEAYLPSCFFGLGPIEAKTVQPPPPAPSYASRGRGFALLRAEEGPAYWDSPKPAVALQFGMYYPHYIHDCFSILRYVANNRMIYARTGKLRAGGYTTRDPFRDHVRGHCGVVVDGLQAKPVDDGNEGTAHHRIREDFAKPVKFVAARAQGIYPDVDQERALFLTDEYLFDLFWLKSTGASAGKPRVYDWQVLTFGDLEGSQAAPWVELDKFADRARADKPHLQDIRVLDAGDRPWTVTALVEPESAAGPGVRVSMLAAKDTLVLTSLTPGDTGYGGRQKERRGRSILATRTAADTIFAALHEPFAGGSGSHRIARFERIERAEEGVAVRIVGKPGSGIDDRILLACGDGANAALEASDREEAYRFGDHAWLRVGAEAVHVVGGIRTLSLPVKGAPRLIVNGREHPARIEGGRLKAEISAAWQATVHGPTPVAAATRPDDLGALIQQLQGPRAARREHAALAIGKWGAAGKAAIPALIAAMKEKVRLGNKAIPEALAGIGPEAVPAIVEAMKSDDPYVRFEATSAVRLLGPKGQGAVAALVRALDDENRAVQINACMALAALGEEAREAAPALRRRLGDPVIGKHAEFVLSGIAPAPK
jgi:hypothetical protein